MNDVLMRGHREQERDAAAWLELVGSYDGYERQAAVEALGRLRHGPAVRPLLARANDWVPQVRAAAADALRGLLDEVLVADWVAGLDGVVALERGRRSDHRELLEGIAAFLGQAKLIPAVLASAAHASAGVKRYIFELQWMQAENDDARFDLLRAALTGPDVILARETLQRMEAGVPATRRRALIGAACCSRFAQIRAEGLRRALAQPAEDTPSLARAMCMDGSALVRAIAFRAVQARGDEAAVVTGAVKYLERAGVRDRDKVSTVQLLWMADRGVALEHCERLQRSPSAALRRVAFAISLTAGSEALREELLLTALADPSAPVQRLAVECVRRGAMVPAASRVVEIGLNHGTAGGLSRALSMLRHTGTWTRLWWLLRAWEQAMTSEQKSVGMEGLERWEIDARNSFVAPTASERAEVQVHWRKVAGQLPEAFVRRARIHLQTYKLE
jgi:hypothetical protein